MSENRIKELIEKIIDPDMSVSFVAKHELASMGEMAVPELLKVFERDPRTTVRYWIIDVLGKMGQKAENAVPTLIKTLEEDTDEGVRAVAAGALEVIVENPKEIVPVLISAFKNDESSRVRDTAALVLNKIASKLGYENTENLIQAFGDG